MGQYLPHVRKVFKLIKTHRKDLEAAVRTKPHGAIKNTKAKKD